MLRDKKNAVETPAQLATRKTLTEPQNGTSSIPIHDSAHDGIAYHLEDYRLWSCLERSNTLLWENGEADSFSNEVQITIGKATGIRAPLEELICIVNIGTSGRIVSEVAICVPELSGTCEVDWSER